MVVVRLGGGQKLNVFAIPSAKVARSPVAPLFSRLSVSCLDWLFGELMSGLEETDLGNRTSVFFSSDHVRSMCRSCLRAY